MDVSLLAISIGKANTLANPQLLRFLERRGCDVLTVADIDLNRGDGRPDESLHRVGWRRWSNESLAYTAQGAR